MKYNFDFLQTGGVPLTNDLMDLIEESYSIFEVIGDIAGNLTIISGCNIIGSTVEPGILAINGKLYYFEGGQVVDTVYIHTENIQKIFQDTTLKTLIYKTTVKFGIGSTGSYNWADFQKLDTLKKIINDVKNKAEKSVVDNLELRMQAVEQKTAPIFNGSIVFIFRLPANQIPLGWKECVDLRGKTVFGWDPNDADFMNLNDNIGSKTKEIKKTNLPNISIGTNLYDRGAGYQDDFSNDNIGTGNSGNEVKTKPLGDGTFLDVLNPGRIVMFIEPNF